jgi:AcrR family transcriptional regulator
MTKRLVNKKICYYFDRTFNQNYFMPRTPEQYDEIRESKRQLIMQVALDLFAHEGFHKTPISKIALQAGISKGLLYNYFTSKEDLLNQIIYSSSMKLLEYFDPNHDGILTDEEFVYYVKQSFKQIKENATFWKLYFTLTMQLDSEQLMNADLNHISEQMNKTFYKYFESKGYENPQMEMMLFAFTMKGIGLSCSVAPDMFPMDDVINSLIKRYIKT